MLFATSLEEHAGWTIIWIGAALGFLWHFLNKIDKKGVVKKQAKGKLIGWLLGWLK